MRKGLFLGSLTRVVLDNANWFGQDDFPATQEWADFIERLFSHIDTQGQFEYYRPQLCGTVSQRNGALSEILTSFFFKRNRFDIISYQPLGQSKNPGDLEVQWKDTPAIFIEVKAPGWKGELSEASIKAGRTNQPKYISGQGGAVDPQKRVKYALDKALPKLPINQPTIVVVAPDLFVSPIDLPLDALEAQLMDMLADDAFRYIGGVLILEWRCVDEVELLHFLVENKSASCLSRLPIEVAEGLKAGNLRDD